MPLAALNMPRPDRRILVTNRVRAALLHTPYYSIQGQERLAKDCGVAHSTISRLVRGETGPSYPLAAAITTAISKRLGVPLAIGDLFSVDGRYEVSCVCDLTPNCAGCFPPEAYTEDGVMRPEYRDLMPGDWCRFPGLSRQLPAIGANSSVNIPTYVSLFPRTSNEPDNGTPTP